MTINFAETQIAPVRAQQGQYIPDDVKRQLLAAQLLQQTAADSSQPVYSKGLGYAKLLAGGLGGFMQGYERNKEDAAQKESSANFAKIMTGAGDASPAPAPDSGGFGGFMGKLFGGGSAPAPETDTTQVAAAPTAQPAAFAPADLAAGLDGKPLPSQITSSPLPAPDAPRGIRNNNPLNIEAGDYTKSQPGFTGSDGRFAKFETPDQGVAAADKLLQTYSSKYGLNTVGGIVGRWAPAGDGNNVSAYAGNVAKQLGVAPDTPLDMSKPEVRSALIGAMGQHENGQPIQMAQAPQGQPAPQQAVAQAAPQAAPQPPAQAPARGAIDPKAIMAILQDPRVPPELKQYALQQIAPQNELVTTPDGTSILVDKKTGNYKPIYQAPIKGTPVKDEESLRNPVTGALLAPSMAQQAQADAAVAAKQNPGAPPSAVIPPMPPGADYKTWQKTVTEATGKSVAQGTLPAAGPETAEVRKEVMRLPSYQNYSSAMPIYRSMLETSGRDSKASDLNLVYGLGKILDPNSVVREGELIMAKNTASLPDWLQGSINSLNGGAALTPETRQRILQEGYGRMKSYEDAFNIDAEHYKGVAERNRMNPLDVIPAFKLAEPYVPTSVNEGLVSQATGGRTPMPQSPQSGQPQQPQQPQASAPVKVASPADARRLPSGTKIILPDGSPGVVP